MYWLRCPDCGESATIDADQLAGRVSIVCPNDACDFHETGRVMPIILSTDTLRRDQQFTVGA